MLFCACKRLFVVVGVNLPDGGPVTVREIVYLIWPIPHMRIGNRRSIYQRRNRRVMMLHGMMLHGMMLHGLWTKLPIYDMRTIAMPCIGVRSRIVRCIRVIIVDYMVWLLGRGLIEMRLRCHRLFFLLPCRQRGKCCTVRPYGTVGPCKLTGTLFYFGAFKHVRFGGRLPHIFTGRRRAWGGTGPFTPISPLLETEDCNCDDGDENGNSSYRASNDCAGAIK